MKNCHNLLPSVRLFFQPLVSMGVFTCLRVVSFGIRITRINILYFALIAMEIYFVGCTHGARGARGARGPMLIFNKYLFRLTKSLRYVINNWFNLPYTDVCIALHTYSVLSMCL